MKRLNILFLFAALAMLFSCSKSEIDTPAAVDPTPKGNLKSLTIVPLIAAQNIPIGNIFIIQDDIQGGISILGSILSPGWMFEDNHIYVGLEAPSSPAPGQFPYSGNISPFGTTLDFLISYEDLGASCGDFYIAFHADVSDGIETVSAWALPDAGAIYWYNPAGKKIGWGAYFTDPVACAPPEIFINEVSAPLGTMHGMVTYQGFIESPLDDQMLIFIDNDNNNPVDDLNLEPDNYLFDTFPNEIEVEYTPEGHFKAGLETTASFELEADVTLPVSIDAIQIMVKSEDNSTQVHLIELYLNGFPIPGIFVGDFDDDDGPPRWNITGDILDQDGGFTLSGMMMLIDPQGRTQSSMVEISFGLQ